MIKKILDYYYLVIFRGYENIYGKYRFFSFHVAGIMSMTLTMNVFSIIILFNRHAFFKYGIWIPMGWAGTNIVTMNVLDAIYNKKRREKLRKEYEDENLESRRLGMARVWFYELFSIAFLIWSISKIELPR